MLAQEEEIRRAAEERQRKEDEEAAKWMNMISVQEAGHGALRASVASAHSVVPGSRTRSDLSLVVRGGG